MRASIACEHQFADEISEISLAAHATRPLYAVGFQKAGKVGILDEHFASKFIFAPLGISEIESISIRPDGSSFVVAGSGRLQLYAMDGQLRQEVEGNSKAVRFSAGGSYLWCIRVVDSNNFILEVRSADDLSKILAQKECEDELYESYFNFGQCPEPDKIVLTQAAGQDGSLVGFARFDNEEITLDYPNAINRKLEPVTPNFNALGTEFLLQDLFDGVYKFAYPSLELLGQYHFPEEIQDPGFWHFFLNERQAIIQYDERYWVLDLKTMEVIEPFQIEGHDLHATSYFYPNLDDDESLMTDVYVLQRIGDQLIGFSGIKNNYSIFRINPADCVAD